MSVTVSPWDEGRDPPPMVGHRGHVFVCPSTYSPVRHVQVSPTRGLSEDQTYSTRSDLLNTSDPP